MEELNSVAEERDFEDVKGQEFGGLASQDIEDVIDFEQIKESVDTFFDPEVIEETLETIE